MPGSRPGKGQRVLTAVTPAEWGNRGLSVARGTVGAVALQKDLEVGELLSAEPFTDPAGARFVVFTWAVRKRKRGFFEWNRDPAKVRWHES